LRATGIGSRRNTLNSSPDGQPGHLAHHLLDGLRDDLQRGISAFMPEAVVDVLEVIDVDDQQRASRFASSPTTRSR